jgi:ParB family chromosome partitioning protein
MKEQITNISADKLKPNTLIRADIDSKTFDYNIDLLADSIKAQGILIPLVVIEHEKSSYLIIDGNRRYVAGVKSGLKEFPCIIKKDITIDQLDVITQIGFSTNELRQDLLPSEETEALKHVVEKGDLTLEQIAESTGKTIHQLKLISQRDQLHPDIKEMVDEGKIAKSAAGSLAPLEPEEQVKVVKTFKALDIPVTQSTVDLYQGKRLPNRGHKMSRKVVKKLEENIGLHAEELDNLKKMYASLEKELGSAHALVKKIWKTAELHDYLRDKHPAIYKDFKSILNILGY